MQVKSHPNNVVIAMKLPYVESPSSKELGNVTLGKYKVTNKVSSMTIVNGLRSVFFFSFQKSSCLGFPG